MIARAVLLCGHSLLLSGVAASLKGCPGLHVTQAATWAETCRLVAEGAPDVLIFELGEAADSRALSLLFKYPGLIMLGLNVECNQAMLISGQGSRSLTLDEIKTIAETGESGRPARLPLG